MARVIVFIIFGGFGLVMLYVGTTQFFQQRRLITYAVKVKAVIIYSAVFTSTSADTDNRLGRSNSTTTHRPDVKFTYDVAGKHYESDLLYPSIIVATYGSRDSAAEELKPFPVGANVEAFVDPSLPDKAFLVKESSIGPIVFILIGVILPPVSWWVGKFI
jgi:hypothetical protein